MPVQIETEGIYSFLAIILRSIFDIIEKILVIFLKIFRLFD